MVRSWTEVEQSPEYQALPTEERRRAGDEYFNDVIAPQLPDNERELAYNEFVTDAFRDSDKEPPKSELGIASGLLTGATKGTLGVAESIFRAPEALVRTVGGEYEAMGIPGAEKIPYYMDQPKGTYEPGLAMEAFASNEMTPYLLAKAGQISRGVADTVSKVGQRLEEPLPVVGNVSKIGTAIRTIANMNGGNVAADYLGKQLEDLDVSKHFKEASNVGKREQYAVNKAFDGEFAPLGEFITDPANIAYGGGQAIPSLLYGMKYGVPGIAALEAGGAASDIAAFEKENGYTYPEGQAVPEGAEWDGFTGMIPNRVDNTDYAKTIIQTTLINSALEKFGIDKLIAGKFGSRLANAALGAGTEFLTEGAQQYNSNLAAWLHYNPDKDLTEGILLSMLGGGLTGGLVGAASAPGGMTRPPHGSRKKEPTQEDFENVLKGDKESTANFIRSLGLEEDIPAPTPEQQSALPASPNAPVAALPAPSSPLALPSPEMEITGFTTDASGVSTPQQSPVPTPPLMSNILTADTEGNVRPLTQQEADEIAASLAAGRRRDIELGMSPSLRNAQRMREVSQQSPEAVKPAIQQVIEAGAEAASSPANSLAEPTEAQKEAGNYKKGHVKLHGLDISIETPRGGVRSGTNPDGSPWTVNMQHDYGYVKRTVGADNEQVDVFIGDNPDSQQVFLIDQGDLDTGRFDEHKAMIGYNSLQQAKQAYEQAFSDGKGADRIQDVTAMSMDEFKGWLKGGSKKAPAGVKSDKRPLLTETAIESKMAEIERQIDLLPVDDRQRASLKSEMEALADDALKLRSGREKAGYEPDTITLDPDEVKVDAKAFQFKEGADKEGVTERLRDVEQYDPYYADTVTVYETKDGEYYIVDGHQRLGLAKRAKAAGQPVTLRATVLKEGSGYTKEDARVRAALKNIAQGSGTALDAAKVLRDTGKDEITGVSRSVQIYRDAQGLKNLSDDVFQAVANEVISPSYGAIIGHVTKVPSEQEAALRILAKTNPANKFQAENIVRQAINSGIVTEVQQGLFGEEQISQSLFEERAKILDNVIKRLQNNKALARTLVSREGEIEQAGNRLNREANLKNLEESGILADTLTKLANRKGEISDALTEAARAYKDGEGIADVSKRFLATLGEYRGAAGQRSVEQRDTSPQPAEQRSSTERTDAGEQRVIPGAERISDKELAERRMQAPNRSDVAQAPANEGLFDLTSRNQENLFDQPKTNKETKQAAEQVAEENEGVFDEDAHDAVMERMDGGSLTAEELKAAFKRAVNSRDVFIREFERRTIPELRKIIGPTSSGYKKADLVNMAYESLLSEYNVKGGVSYNPMSEKYSDGLKRVVESTTDEDIKQYVERRKKRHDEMVQTYKDPQTLDQFREFVRMRGVGALSTEQRVRYDELIGREAKEKSKKEAERKATVKAVDTGDIGMSMVETKHTKKGHDLYVVKLDSYTDKETFSDLRSRAKQLGGYYSNYRGGGAVPGFQFTDKETAEKFMSLQEGDLSGEEQVEARAEQRAMSAAEKLADQAERLREKSQSSLDQDRKVNTARRAAMADSAEAKAQADIAIANTMENLSKAIENNEVEFIDRISTRTEIEMLDSILRQAVWESDRGLSYSEQQQRKGRKPTDEDITKAKYPYPHIHKETLLELAHAIENVSGYKRIATAWKRAVKNTKPDSHIIYFTGQESIDNLQKVLNGFVKNNESLKWRVSGLKDSYMDYSRMQRLGLPNPASMRAALREFVKYRGKKADADPIKAAERALAGRKFDGYFPTPTKIVERMLEEAQIEKGNRILEPSAGKGNIADAITQDMGSDVDLSVIELVSDLRSILEAKGHNVVGNNFLEHEGEYDRILMNPPFEKGQDIEHVRHAYDMLAPGGRVVAIMSEGPFFRSDKKSAEFREWLESNGGTSEKLPEGSFKDSDRSTGVNTRLVTIQKNEDISFLRLGKESAEQFSDRMFDKYGVNVSLSERADGTLYLASIKVQPDEQERGLGTKVMRKINKYADSRGKTITLTPTKAYGARSISDLKRFYKNVGFVENSGKHKDASIRDAMYRKPKRILSFQTPENTSTETGQYHIGNVGLEPLEGNSKLFSKAAKIVAREMKAVGGDNVKLVIPKSIVSNGDTMPGFHMVEGPIDTEMAKSLIFTAYNENVDYMLSVMDHEVIHHLYKGGALKDVWNDLVTEATKEDGWFKEHNIKDRYRGEPELKQIEEAIAEGYRAWRSGSDKVRRSARVEAALTFIKRIFRNIRKAITGELGVKRWEEIFEDISIGKYKNETNYADVTPDERRIMFSRPTPESINDGISFMKKEMGDDTVSKMMDDHKKTLSDIMNSEGKPYNSNVAWARYILRTNDHMLEYFGNKFNSKTVKEIRKMLWSGAGEALEAGSTYEESVDRHTMTYLAKLGNARDGLTSGDLLRITPYLQHPDKVPPGRLKKAVFGMAEVMARHKKWMTENGVKLGDIEGYFPRSWLTDKIIANESDFRERAAQVYINTYRDVFTKEAKSKLKSSGQVVNEAKFIEQEIEKQASDMVDRWLDNIMLRERGINPDQNNIIALFGAAPSPSSSLKPRVLDKSADDLLRPYLEQDPVQAIMSMIVSTTRRVEFNKRFGEGKWGELRKKMIDEGLDGEAIEYVKGAILSSTHNITNLKPKSRAIYAQARALTYMTYLPHTTLTSISEFAIVGMRTRDIRDSFKSLAYSIADLAKMDNVSEARAIAEDIIGVVGEIAEDLLMETKASGGQFDNKKIHKNMQTFFRWTGLTQWTSGTRVAAVKIGQAYIRRLSSDIVNKTSTEKSSRRFLKELGVPDGKLDEFAKWVVETGLSYDALSMGEKIGEFTPIEEYGRVAMQRFVHQVIQSPKASERQYWAQHPLGNILLSLQAFSYSFSKNVLIRDMKLAKEAFAGKDYTFADRYALFPSTLAYMLTLAVAAGVNRLRDNVLFPWEGYDDQEEWQKIFSDISRAGYFGGLDQVINIVTGAKYRREPATIAAGPLIGGWSELFMNAVGYFTHNSDKTNTAERNTAKSFYKSVAQPFLTLMALRMPAYVGVPAIQLIAHPKTKEAFMTGVGGEDNRKNKKSSGRLK